jgi:CDP-paratose 2-epimerase
LGQNRVGDHICYISNLRKLKSHFPEWGITIGIDEILRQIVAEQSGRVEKAALR